MSGFLAGEEGALNGEPREEGVRCCGLTLLDGKRRWVGVRVGVASPMLVLHARQFRYKHNNYARGILVRLPLFVHRRHVALEQL